MEKQQQRITIIIPVFNTEQYIDKCLQSITSQTYANMQIILIDDGSTDNSLQRCNEWGNKDNRILVIHTENHGVSHARNVGIDAAVGEYVAFLDSDDWVDVNYYEHLLRNLQKYDADISCGGYVRETSKGPVYTLAAGKCCAMTAEEALLEMYSFKRDKIFLWELCDKLFRRDLFEDIRLDENIDYCEDQWMTWQILKKVRCFAYIPLRGYHYVMRGNSATHGEISTNKLLDPLFVIRRIFNDAEIYSNKFKQLLQGHILIRESTFVCRMLAGYGAGYEAEIRKARKHISEHITEYLFYKGISIKDKIKMCIAFLGIGISFLFRLRDYFERMTMFR